jgi:hypothetical protein
MGMTCQRMQEIGEQLAWTSEAMQQDGEPVARFASNAYVKSLDHIQRASAWLTAAAKTCRERNLDANKADEHRPEGIE